jgi:hypothetical protein
MPHDLGDVTPQALVGEAKKALSFYRTGMEQLVGACYSEAMDSFFKAAAIAVNVTFTARTHDTALPESAHQKMELLVASATKGIQKVMKAVAMKKVLKHEALFHESSEVPATAVATTAGFGDSKVELTFIPHPDRIQLFFHLVGAGVPRTALKAVPGGVLVENGYLATVQKVTKTPALRGEP